MPTFAGTRQKRMWDEHKQTKTSRKNNTIAAVGASTQTHLLTKTTWTAARLYMCVCVVCVSVSLSIKQIHTDGHANTHTHTHTQGLESYVCSW